MSATPGRKGQATRTHILDQALDLSTELGLEGMSVGVLAKVVGMSKSGLYAHFDSKEALQVAVLDHAAHLFVERVVKPALKRPRGLGRVRALFEGWMVWSAREFPGGCPFVQAASDMHSRPGLVREAVGRHLRDVLDVIERSARTAVESGEFRSDLNLAQFAYEFWANIVSYQHYGHFLELGHAPERARLAFEGMVQRALSAKPQEKQS